ncbi:S-layer homology domain-containing protein [Arthrobacter sp. NPDC080031]|uniref:S-layer homology domain-containing protein n=1 Tax=Arthrobacter sp. NPDC080031 TaxID=3155918 RepID=UPI00344DE2E8
MSVLMWTSVFGIAAPAAHAAPNTIITLTFDDANADQIPAAAILKSNGLKGTFFTPSGFLNAPNYMTTQQALALQADGNEIGGHTVTHPDLAQMGADEVKRQVCNDRVNLTNMGFTITNFAYPFASLTPAVESTVAACGYNSARGLGDLESVVPGSAGLGFAETLPPADPYKTKAPDEVDNTWTLTDLQNVVSKAEPGGGWVQVTFHHIGTGIDPTSGIADPLTVSTALFTQYVQWLAAEKAAGRIAVQTVQETLGGAVKPVVAGPAAPPPVTAGNLVKNASLETAGPVASGLPQCWAQGSYGSHTSAFTTVTPGHGGTAGTHAEQLVMSAYVSGDAKLVPTLDLGECAPSATPGHTYEMKAWYTSTTTTQYELYYRTGLGTWTYWTASPYFPASTTWAHATWTSPALPAGASAISLGLNLLGNGTLTTDDFELYDSAGIRHFTDVTPTSAFYDEISWLSNNLISQGWPDNTYRPLTSITREAMAAFLYRFSGSPAVPANAPAFSDVPAGAPFYNEIRWLASTRITTGYPDGTFHPGEAVSRAAMAAFLYRLKGSPAVPANAPTFSDVPAGAPFYNEIRWLASTGITTGFPDGTYRPTTAINRDAMAAFLYRYNIDFPKG